MKRTKTHCKTHLESWRDKQTYKSKRRALIQVRSWRTVFLPLPLDFPVLETAPLLLHNDDVFAQDASLPSGLAIITFHRVPEKHFSKSSCHSTRADLMMMTRGEEETFPNQNFPIDSESQCTHIHIRKHEREFSARQFSYFPIIGISSFLFFPFLFHRTRSVGEREKLKWIFHPNICCRCYLCFLSTAHKHHRTQTHTAEHIRRCFHFSFSPHLSRLLLQFIIMAEICFLSTLFLFSILKLPASLASSPAFCLTNEPRRWFYHAENFSVLSHKPDIAYLFHYFKS